MSKNTQNKNIFSQELEPTMERLSDSTRERVEAGRMDNRMAEAKVTATDTARTRAAAERAAELLISQPVKVDEAIQEMEADFKETAESHAADTTDAQPTERPYDRLVDAPANPPSQDLIIERRRHDHQSSARALNSLQ